MRRTQKLLRLALAAAAARGSAPRPSRALAGHDHDHPVCDEEYRTTVCPVAWGRMKRQGSVSVDAAYRAMPTHHTPTDFDAKGSSGQSAWAGMMPDAAAAPPTPVNRASKWPGWKK